MTASASRIENDSASQARALDGAARRAAEDAGRRSFLRLVSHELRTPLNSIIGFSEIIADELYGPISDPRYREHAEIVRASGLKLLKLVNDVIEVARLEAGVADLDLRPEDPLSVLETVAEALAGEARARCVRLSVHAAPTPLVLADDRSLKTALVQLVQNAIAFSPEGGEVRLGLRSMWDSVAFDVADEGPGVPIRDLQRILRPFEQGADALTRRSEGAGLGLPIARLLSEAMGGKLRLQSEPGRGLCASIHLPAAPRQEVPPHQVGT
jgi:signal transduction histidine kinase